MTRYLKTKLMIKSVLQNFDTTDDKVSETLFNVYRPEFEALIDMINQNFTPNDVLNNSESTGGVSSPVQESGVLHDVGDSHAERSSTKEDSEGLGGEALESITDLESLLNDFETWLINKELKSRPFENGIEFTIRELRKRINHSRT